MSFSNYDFNGFTINLYVDEQGDWLAHFQEMPNISAFGDTPQQALEELKLAWELVKEDYQQKGKDIPVAPMRQKLSSLL
ncbi:MAG: type II toxin-antitoxin system HicB family antitoxin [Gloeotrichia echinulata DVL01]|jgi:predicted RNase H-like HicB family nuclease